MVLFLTTHPHIHLHFLPLNQIQTSSWLTMSQLGTLTPQDPTKGLPRTSLPVGATQKFASALFAPIYPLLLPQFTCGTLELGPYLAFLEHPGSRIILST